jgi:hypothetical protein
MSNLAKLPWFATVSDKEVDHARVCGQARRHRTSTSRAATDRCRTHEPSVGMENEWADALEECLAKAERCDALQEVIVDLRQRPEQAEQRETNVPRRSHSCIAGFVRSLACCVPLTPFFFACFLRLTRLKAG